MLLQRYLNPRHDYVPVFVRRADWVLLVNCKGKGTHQPIDGSPEHVFCGGLGGGDSEVAQGQGSE